MQVDEVVERLGDKAAKIEEAATHKKILGKTEELLGSIDLEQYLADGTVRPARDRSKPDSTDGKKT